jgi:hypothetical protein
MRIYYNPRELTRYNWGHWYHSFRNSEYTTELFSYWPTCLKSLYTNSGICYDNQVSAAFQEIQYPYNSSKGVNTEIPGAWWFNILTSLHPHCVRVEFRVTETWYVSPNKRLTLQ